jgi:hypothetical protein
MPSGTGVEGRGTTSLHRRVEFVNAGGVASVLGLRITIAESRFEPITVKSRRIRRIATVVVLAIPLLFGARLAFSARGGQLQLQVIDRDSSQPLACRLHLTSARGKAQKAGSAPFWHDHFVFDGSITLKLPPGDYNFDAECGPEYLIRRGHFTINDFAEDEKVVDMKRIADLNAEGWWSGDMNVHRSPKDLPLLMKAETLNVAQAITWGNVRSATNPAADVRPKTLPKEKLAMASESNVAMLLGGIASGRGGTVLLLGGDAPISLPKPTAEFPTSASILRSAREKGVDWVDVPKLASRDLPIWVALGLVDSVEVCGPQLGRKTTTVDASGARPFDKKLFSGVEAPGRWDATIYYHLLNCGLRIPPSAGSGSGLSTNPVGYNRVYVRLGDEFSYEKWRAGLKAGRVVVSNGPLLRPSVEGEPPGHVFQGDAGQEIELELGLKLSTQEKIAYLELLRNGRVAQSFRLDEWAKMKGRLPKQRFTESGWFLLRAVAESPGTYRFASTGPYYVEIGYQKRISRNSVQFFLDWLAERRAQWKLDDPNQAATANVELDQAEQFWQNLLAKANAD